MDSCLFILQFYLEIEIGKRKKYYEYLKYYWIIGFRSQNCVIDQVNSLTDPNPMI